MVDQEEDMEGQEVVGLSSGLVCHMTRLRTLTSMEVVGVVDRKIWYVFILFYFPLRFVKYFKTRG